MNAVLHGLSHGRWRGFVVLLTLALLLPLPVLAQGSSSSSSGQSVDWPSYGNDLGAMHYQNLDQINPSNVSQLQPAWILHTGIINQGTSFENQPIMTDGMLFVTTGQDHVLALDPATGDIKWSYSPDLPNVHLLPICCGMDNRGVAVGKGKVFLGQLDATLVALDEHTGKIVWQVPVADWHLKQFSETVAPVYVDGKVIIGISGAEFKARGYVSAYDADTGKLLWRFFTVPAPTDTGHASWAGTSWLTGGATIWGAPTIDTKLGMVYFATSNPAPAQNGSQRAGDNLFAASIVAVDLNTGKLKWFFQEVHHDLWDYDGPEPTLLFDLQKNGQTIPAIGHANKDGWYFILDRRDGKPVYPVHEVPAPAGPAWQNASPTQPEPETQELIPHGVLSITKPPSGVVAAPMWTPPQETPILVQPGFESGPEWPPAAFSPRTKYVYVPAGGYLPFLVQSLPNADNSFGSTGEATGIPPTYGLFDALDTTTGKIAWQYKEATKTVSGVAVAGDLVFSGESTPQLNAWDAKSGQLLWHYVSHDKGVGGANGSPTVYEYQGREYVVMAFGGNVDNRFDNNSTTSLPGDALIAFALPAGAGSPAASASSAAKPHVVMANLKEVNGARFVGKLVEPMAKPPAGAFIVEVAARDYAYFPSTFTVPPGATVAVHLRNTGIGSENMAVSLPTGDVAIHAGVAEGKDAYFVFTAPDQPGTYQIYNPSFSAGLYGQTGAMIVAGPGTPTTSAPVRAASGAATPEAKPTH